jgi:hypothetical protein
MALRLNRSKQKELRKRLIRAERASLRELIIGVGFVEGLWIAAGINPQNVVFGWLNVLFTKIHASPSAFIILKIVPILLLAASILIIWRMGRWLGMLALGLAFAAGFMVVSKPTLAVFLLLGSLVLGGFARRRPFSGSHPHKPAEKK